ncbi:MAG: ribosomal protein S18 acetylase RimI-like enzyme [Candidatus Aldehydirespiratoraceae bacterium]|jgi:ribosomal protein S18 acetylase RimI-like enzyme
MTIEVSRIQVGDGALLRGARLAALLDGPSAFAVSYEAEAAHDEGRWETLAAERSAGRDHATFFALERDIAVGLVGGHRNGDVAELVSMWTSPAARGQSLGAKLVEMVIERADGDAIELWVTHGNDRAQRLYERHGFAVTGEVAPLPSDPCKDELRMRREPI